MTLAVVLETSGHPARAFWTALLGFSLGGAALALTVPVGLAPLPEWIKALAFGACIVIAALAYLEVTSRCCSRPRVTFKQAGAVVEVVSVPGVHFGHLRYRIEQSNGPQLSFEGPRLPLRFGLRLVARHAGLKAILSSRAWRGDQSWEASVDREGTWLRVEWELRRAAASERQIDIALRPDGAEVPAWLLALVAYDAVVGLARSSSTGF